MVNVHPTKSASVGLPQVHPIANYDILMEPEIVDAEILISRLLSTGESKGYNGRYLIYWIAARIHMVSHYIKICVGIHLFSLLWCLSKIGSGLVIFNGPRDVLIQPRNDSTFRVVVALVLILITFYGIFMGILILVGILYFILIYMMFFFMLLWLWTDSLQKFCENFTSRYVIQQNKENKQPVYHVDTKQKHYPRKRIPNRGFVFCSKNRFPRLTDWLDDHKDVDIDIPDTEEEPGNHCICSFVMKLHPPDPIHSFMVYFCERREDDAFYELCSAFDVPESVRVLIATNNSSMTIRCLDALHRIYHRDSELTLAIIKTKLSEYSDDLKQIISDYHA